MGHGRAIASSPDAESLARAIVAGGLSVRQAEDRARAAKGGNGKIETKSSKGDDRPVDADLAALERQLGDLLGLRVKVAHQLMAGHLVGVLPALRPLVAAYRFDLPGTQPTKWLPRLQTEFPLDSGWQILRFQLNGIADLQSDHLTIHWLDGQGQTLWTDARPFEWTPHLHPTSTFEFGQNLWPKSFIRIRGASGTPTRVKIESSLRSAKINHIEIGLP